MMPQQMKDKIRILSTKKLNNAYTYFLKEAGFALKQEDFISTKSIDFSIDLGTDNVCEGFIFTSKNAVKSVVLNAENTALKAKGVFCVGQKTKRELEKNGFEVMICANSAMALSQEIIQLYPNKSFTYFCGNLRRDILPSEMKLAGVSLNEVIVYITELTPHKIYTKPDAILFFSPSAVESFEHNNNINNELCVCIGHTTAEALEGKTTNILLAKQPTEESIVEKVMEHYML